MAEAHDEVRAVEPGRQVTRPPRPGLSASAPESLARSRFHPTPPAVVMLQRAAGNAAVSSLLAPTVQRDPPRGPLAADPVELLMDRLTEHRSPRGAGPRADPADPADRNGAHPSRPQPERTPRELLDQFIEAHHIEAAHQPDRAAHRFIRYDGTDRDLNLVVGLAEQAVRHQLGPVQIEERFGQLERQDQRTVHPQITFGFVPTTVHFSAVQRRGLPADQSGMQIGGTFSQQRHRQAGSGSEPGAVAQVSLFADAAGQVTRVQNAAAGAQDALVFPLLDGLLQFGLFGQLLIGAARGSHAVTGSVTPVTATDLMIQASLGAQVQLSIPVNNGRHLVLGGQASGSGTLGIPLGAHLPPGMTSEFTIDASAQIFVGLSF